MAKPLIFFKIPDVVADYMTAACSCNKIHYDDHTWPAGETNIVRAFADVENAELSSEEQFNTAVAAKGEQFYARLQPSPWFQSFMETVKRYGDFRILITSHNKHKVSGLLEWTQRRFSPAFEGVVLVSLDDLGMVAEGNIVIDTREEFVEKWERAGGKDAIAFPQPWNGNYDHMSERVSWLNNRLAEIFGDQSSPSTETASDSKPSESESANATPSNEPTDGGQESSQPAAASASQPRTNQRGRKKAKDSSDNKSGSSAQQQPLVE